MYWSGCQSTGAEIRKYLTVLGLAPLHYTPYRATRWQAFGICAH